MTVRTRAQLNSDADTNLPDNTVGSITPAKLRAIAKNMADSAKLAEDSSDTLTEGTTNLFFTAARVRAAVLTGLSTATNAVISATDTVLSGMGKLQKQITDLSSSAAPKASPVFTGAVTLAQDPAAALQAATKQYVDNLAMNVGKRGTVRVATTANITISTALNAADVLDGVTLVAGDLALVMNQTAPAENGIYVVGASPARSSEFDTYDEHPGALIAVREGTVAADTLWLCTSNTGGTLNTTAIVFSAVALSLVDDSVTNAKLANVATATLKGRATAGTGDPEDLTPTQARSVLSLGTAALKDTGTSGNTVPLLDGANTWSGVQTFSAIPVLSGGAISFPATQIPSSDANTLDDYEEGTFTSSVAGTTTAGVGTYTSQQGKYTKIGNMVAYNITVVWTAHTGTGNIQINGLPFTSASVSAVAAMYLDVLTYTGTHLQAINGAGSTSVSIQQTSSNAGATSVPMDTAARITLSGQYFTS